MVALEKIHAAQTRIASHYLDKLRLINQTYVSGGDNVTFALSLFDAEWEQIRRWQNWTVQNRQFDLGINEVCAKYSITCKDVLPIRLAFTECIAWYQSSLGASIILENSELIVENLLNLADVYDLSGDSQQAIDHAMKVFDYYDENSDVLYVGKANTIIAHAEMSRGNIPTSHEYYQKSLNIFQKHREILLIADVQYNLSTIAGRLGDYDAVDSYIQQALPVFERYGNILQVGNCYNVLGLLARMQFRLDEAVIYLGKSVTQFESINFAAGLAKALANLASILVMSEKYNEAEIVAYKSLKQAQLSGSKRAIVDAYIRLGRIYVDIEQYEKAEHYLLEAISVSETLDHPYALTVCLQILGMNAMRVNRLDDAIAYLERGIPVAYAAEDSYMISHLFVALCEALLKQGKIPQAQQALYESIEPADKGGSQTQINIIPAAIELAREMGKINIATRWLGVINGKEILAQTQANLDGIHETLLPLASQEQFAKWYHEGQSLTIEETLLEIKQVLENELT